MLNDGIPRESSTALRARFVKEVARVRPMWVVVYTGMNDAVNDRKFATAHTFSSNVQSMLDAAKVAGARPLLVALQPVDEQRLMQRHALASYGTRPPNLRVQELDTVLRSLAARNGVPLVPFDEVLQKAGGPDARLSTDGVHLSASGYALLAAAVWKVLQPAWRHGDTVLCVGDSLTFGQGVRPQGTATLDAAGRPYPTYPEQLQELIAEATNELGSR